MTFHPLPAAELHARLLLHSLPHIGPQRYLQLMAWFGDADAACRASAGAWQALNIPQDAIAARSDAATHRTVEHSLRWLEQEDCHLLLHDSPEYPCLLSETAAAPPLLFVQGSVALLQQPQLAIIGSRNASPAGEQMARQFGKALAASGCCITSGMALGIDTAAHRGALEGHGKTLAVVGTGLLQTYPRRNLELRQQILTQGGSLVSELPLAAGPHASHFPRRNRIISGLSLGVLVVEAGVSSGSLITARYAAEQGRDVFAIPGSVHHPGSKGCHQLIREGAILVESVQDILQEWRHWQLVAPPAAEVEEPAAATKNGAAHPLLELLCSQPMHTDELALRLDMEIDGLLTELTNLEIEGRIRQQAGQWFYLG